MKILAMTKIEKSWLLASVILMGGLSSMQSFASKDTVVFTVRSPEFPGDNRYVYGSLVLKLALEKTKPDFGSYVLEYAPSMKLARAKKSLSENRYSNFMYALTYDLKMKNLEGIDYVPFPIVRGLLGYRVCFYPESEADRINKVVASGNISSLVHGQGLGWTDVDILKHNKISVAEVADHESLFKMVAAGRFDLFCRGANEVFKEYNHFSYIKGLSFDRSFVIHYELPVFFFTHQHNVDAIKRVNVGLVRAFEDGSLTQLLRKYYGEGINFVRLEKRKVFELKNPFVESLPPAYKQYNLNPKSLVAPD